MKYILNDGTRHNRLLASLQKLRGEIYLSDRAISIETLTTDGRHIQKDDTLSWHLLTVNENEEVLGCIRFCAHGPGVVYTDLAVSHSVSERLDIGPKVEEAVRADIEEARRLGFLYVELGGWALREEVRCTTEAVRMLLMTYSLAQLLGGAYGLSTATTRHHSSSILRRLGGRSLTLGTHVIPSYHDPRYGCEMELLRFDSTSPNPRYADWIRSCCEVLLESQVIAAESRSTDSESLLNLNVAVSESSNRAVPLATIGDIGNSERRLRGQVGPLR